MRFPFEVAFEEVRDDLDYFVFAVFASLESDFLVLPKGDGFIEYPTFEHGYEALKRATAGFNDISVEPILKTVLATPISLVVLRALLGFTPPEWAYEATLRTGVDITQGWIRSLDRRLRRNSEARLQVRGATLERIHALVASACALLQDGAPDVAPEKIHRLDKADTKHGAESLRQFARMGVPYPVLLYERYLGRPFAGHRDSVSELVGGGLESAIEGRLDDAGISYRKTKRAERIPGFDQAPDFVIPSEFSPRIVIEAKVTQDDGTARDKVTRIQHLAALSADWERADGVGFEVVACIAGRGFGIRKEDMRKLLLATRGKVFTLQNLDRMVDHTALRDFRSV